MARRRDARLERGGNEPLVDEAQPRDMGRARKDAVDADSGCTFDELAAKRTGGVEASS